MFDQMIETLKDYLLEINLHIDSWYCSLWNKKESHLLGIWFNIGIRARQKLLQTPRTCLCTEKRKGRWRGVGGAAATIICCCCWPRWLWGGGRWLAWPAITTGAGGAMLTVGAGWGRPANAVWLMVSWGAMDSPCTPPPARWLGVARSWLDFSCNMDFVKIN